MIRCDYGTDNGPHCAGCGGTVYAYQADQDPSDVNRRIVMSECVRCGERMRFGFVPCKGDIDAVGLRRVHGNHARFRIDKHVRAALAMVRT